MRGAWLSVAGAAALSLFGWGGYRLWPRVVEFHPLTVRPVWERIDGRDVMRVPGQYLVAEVAVYDDELFAYLMFQYLRRAEPFKQADVFLTYRREGGTLVYPIQVNLPNDLIGAFDLLARAEQAGLIDRYEWRYVDISTLQKLRYQTRVFTTAYNLGARRKLEDLSRTELVAYVRRFIRYKSATDPRIRSKIEPVPRPLTRDEASLFAADIVAVADFYSLPLDFFLGIGAMENNYMNVDGDLENTVWKRRAEKGDMVLKQRRGRVLVLNPSSGAWQITRETLRYVHRLYLKDARDYNELPARLRPPAKLDLDNVDPSVLTTYAGLLFRKLLDDFGGDVETAVGAYNGGAGNPNPKYAAGARTAAAHARLILEQAAVLNGRPAAEMQFLTAR